MAPSPLLLLAAALPLLVPGPGSPPETSPRGPRIALEPAQLRFGRVLQGRTLSRRLLIRNLGDQDLVIEQVASGCDCAVALADGTRIRPGESAPVRVTLRTGSASGRITRTLLVKSNDPTQAAAQVSLEATVVTAGPSGAEP